MPPPTGVETREHLPPATKKLLGSWPSGSETRRAVMPCCRRRRERHCAACWPLPFAVRVKGQIDSSGSVAELPELVRVEMVSHRAGDVVKTGLPQHGVIEEALDENHFRMEPDLFPAVQAAFGAGQEAVRRRRLQRGCGHRGCHPAEKRCGVYTHRSRRQSPTRLDADHASG